MHTKKTSRKETPLNNRFLSMLRFLNNQSF